MAATVHIIGAGLAGLSAAVTLAGEGRRVALYEASAHAGGRCRSYYDAAFGGTIDNGNHLLLSGNDTAFNYLKRIGGLDAFGDAQKPVFHFADWQSKERWALQLNKGLLPLWLLNKDRRVPGTKPTDYLSVLCLLSASSRQTVVPLLNENTVLYRRLWQPLFVSALNTHPREASAHLAAAVLRGSLLKGGSACIPKIADGLSAAFIDPALRYLSARGGSIDYNRRLRRIGQEAGIVTRLEFTSGGPVTLGPSDSVICAVPCWGINELLPGIEAPQESRAILNAHFRITPPCGFPRILGVVGATVEWIFAFPDRISITVSDADRLMPDAREELAGRIWREVSALTGLAASLPPWQIVKEKRATFAATPLQDAKRPGTLTPWRNLYLAGDWVQTGLPATIEGAVRSGRNAAQALLKRA